MKLKRLFNNIKLSALDLLGRNPNINGEKIAQNVEAPEKADEKLSNLGNDEVAENIVDLSAETAYKQQNKSAMSKCVEINLTAEEYDALIQRLAEIRAQKHQPEVVARKPKPPTIKQGPKKRIYREPMQGTISTDDYILRKADDDPLARAPLTHAEKVSLADTKHLCHYSEEIELRPEEILLLDFLDGMSSDLYLPEYFTWKYHIDFKSTFERFGKGGYLEYAPIEYSLSKQKKETLQRLLEQQGMAVKGRKNELAKRLIEHSNPNLLCQFQKSYFAITEKGKKQLKKPLLSFPCAVPASIKNRKLFPSGQ